MEPNDTPTLHLYVLLDRSGSMSAMAADVVEGFNTMLTEQATAGGAAARMTFVQFDNGDPQEILADAIPLAEVAPLTEHTFEPRGATPLLDATGRLLGKAMTRAQTLAEPESVVFATITDGYENASTEFSLKAIKKLIKQQTDVGWTFVFLGADPSSYDEADKLGYDARSAQHFAADGVGARAAFSELSRATTARRGKLARKESIDAGDYFEGRKDADADRERRDDR